MVKGTTGTHYKDMGKRRTKAITLRLTQDQYDMIQGKAQALGISATEFLVGTAERRRVPGYVKGSQKDTQIPGQISIDDMDIREA